MMTDINPTDPTAGALRSVSQQAQQLPQPVQRRVTPSKPRNPCETLFDTLLRQMTDGQARQQFREWRARDHAMPARLQGADFRAHQHRQFDLLLLEGGHTRQVSIHRWQLRRDDDAPPFTCYQLRFKRIGGGLLGDMLPEHVVDYSPDYGQAVRTAAAFIAADWRDLGRFMKGAR